MLNRSRAQWAPWTKARRRAEHLQSPFVVALGSESRCRSNPRVRRPLLYPVRYSLAAADHRRASVVEDRAAAAAVNLSRRPLGQTPVSPSLSQILTLRSKSNGPILFCLPKRYRPMGWCHIAVLVSPLVKPESNWFKFDFQIPECGQNL
jgi:hypothetical protein